MENNKIQAYGYTSDDETIEKHKKKLSKVPATFYSMGSVSYKTGISRIMIYSLLREYNCLDEDNIPLQNYIDEGYFQYDLFYEKHKIKGMVSVSQKGVNLILNLYRNHK
jgi:hypothetical protein